MSKKEDEDLDDEKDLPEQEEELEEEKEAEEESDEEGQEKSKDESTEDDSEQSEEETEEDKADREAIRERRRRERKLRKERDKREKFQMQNTISTLQETVKQQTAMLEKVTGHIVKNETSNIDSQMQELSGIYQEAQSRMEEAINKNDGAAFRKSKEIADRAWAKYNTLELSKRQRSVKTETKEDADDTSSTRTETSTQQKFGREVQSLAQKWASKHSGWYNGTNLDSKIVVMLDKDLYDEGYDPETQEYWDELEDRVKERLPHRFKSAQNKRPRVITGGGGDRQENGNSNIEKTLPKEFIQTLKMSGYWDDPKKKKAAINDYIKNRKAKG